MSYTWQQTTPDKAVKLAWLPRSIPVVDPVTGAATGETVTDPGLSSIYASVNLFTQIPGCVVDTEGFIRQPDPTGASRVALDTVAGGTRITTTKEINSFKVVVSLPGLYSTDDKGFQPATVLFSVFYREYKPAPNNGVWSCATSRYNITAKQTGEITRTISSPHLGTTPKIYDILLTRHNVESSSNNLRDSLYLKELIETVDGEIAYNNTALLGLKIRATDQLSGSVPTVTSLVKGVKIALPHNLHTQERYDSNGNYRQEYIDQYANEIWDGTLTWDEKTQLGTRHWTDNPVWCLYDLLTNRRYGLGDYYKIADNKIGLMRANFYLMAKYCDEMITYTDDSVQPSVVRKRPRFTINMVVDQTKSAMEWVSQIAGLMRGSLYYSEGIFWLDIDRVKPVSALYNMSNIKDYTQSCTPFRQIPNSYEVQWINPQSNYEIDTFRVEAPELQSNPTLEERKKVLTLIGVTNMDQAKALTRYALISGQSRTKMVTFKTGTEGLRSAVGDVIAIQHDVPQWGFGGKITSFSVPTTTSTLHLSDSFQYASGEMKIAVSSPGKNPAVLAVTEPEAAGSYDTLTVTLAYVDDEGQSHTYAPAVGDSYYIYSATMDIAKFKIGSIRRDSDELCEITAVEYTDELFSLCDNTSAMGTIKTGNYSLATLPKRDSVQGITITQKIYQDTSGSWKVGIDIGYERPQNNPFWRGAQVHYAKQIPGEINVTTGNYVSSTVDTTGSIFIPEITESGRYLFVITSIYVQGKQTVFDALEDTDHAPYSWQNITLAVPNELFMAGVTGLKVKGNLEANTQFLGKDCTVCWNTLAPIDASIPATGSLTVGDGTNNSWLKDYEVQVWTTVNPVLRRTERVVIPEFTYTHEMNHQDGVTRHLTFKVTAYNRLGEASAVKTISVTNPAPAAI